MAGLHAISVPVLIHYLGRLDGLLARLAAFAEKTGRRDDDLLATALAEGMFDLRRQIVIAAGFSMRSLAPLAPELGALRSMEGRTIAELRAGIAQRIAALAAVDATAIDAGEARIVVERAGEAAFETDALAFVTRYALPNFFFHLSMAYAILRSLGLAVGKADFDGFHAYAPDFRFV